MSDSMTSFKLKFEGMFIEVVNNTRLELECTLQQIQAIVEKFIKTREFDTFSGSKVHFVEMNRSNDRKIAVVTKKKEIDPYTGDLNEKAKEMMITAPIGGYDLIISMMYAGMRVDSLKEVPGAMIQSVDGKNLRQENIAIFTIKSECETSEKMLYVMTIIERRNKNEDD